MEKKYFAFDFDGVITHFNEETIGKPNIETINAMRILKKQGHVIIIFSTRKNEVLKNYCLEHNVPYDYINENPESEYYENSSKGKVVADVYLDDKALRYTGQNAEELINLLTNFKQYKG